MFKRLLLKNSYINYMNNLRVSLRYFSKNKFSSLLNIAGLAIGLTGFMCIMLYVEHEFSFDRLHARHQDTYRVVKDFVSPDGSRVPDATTPPALAKALISDVADVEAATRFAANGGRLYLLQHGDKKFYETELLRVDQEFFRVFDFKFVAGNKEKSLDQIHSIILTQSTAAKYFGSGDAIGKVIRMNVNNGTDYVVTGVVEDVPDNSHFTFNVIIPYESRRDWNVDWQQSMAYTYVILKHDNIDIQTIVNKNLPNTLDEYYLQRLDDIHLHSNLKSELLPNGDITYVRILLMIGVFILAIACINYINLVTARSAERAREVGIRKAIGALRGQLVKQFLLESTLTVLASLVISYAIVFTILPMLAPITGTNLTSFVFKSRVAIWSVPFALLISLVAGCYPAFYLSAFQPLRTLRGSVGGGQQGSSLRKALVVFQFTMSSALIAGTLIIASQLDFMKGKSMGFNKDNVLLVPNVRGGIGASSTLGAWDDHVRRLPGVLSISRADGILGADNSMNGVGYAPTNAHISLNFIRIDYDFIPTLEIELAAGRNFSREFISDTTAIILNDEAVKQLGLQEPVLGKQLTWDDDAEVTHEVTIVGIAKDFHFTDLHTAIRPFAFILEVNNGSNFFIRTSSADLGQTIQDVAGVWSTFNPGKPFDYSFQDQYVAKLHLNDERFEKLFSLFTALAIIIACLGLFGLTAFLAESRTKEIGVRKILGASVTSILGLVSKEYLAMILASLVVALPLAYYVMTSWLQNFAYRIDIGWQLFALAGMISIVLAIVTISFHAIKVATRNPVESLRSE
jgi:putative ABC transport system permease protein